MRVKKYWCVSIFFTLCKRYLGLL